MKSTRLFQLTSTSILLTLLCTIVTAQSEIPKTEVGVHYTGLRLDRFDNVGPGIGGRVTRNLNDNLAVEGEINFFPQSRPFDRFVVESEEKFQGLFGVKAGLRRNKFGLFLKARPGFLRAKHYALDKPGCVSSDSCVEGRTLFNFDVGGVFEFYPQDRFLLRVDVGDTVIRLSRRYLNTPEINPVKGCLQISAGVGYRF